MPINPKILIRELAEKYKWGTSFGTGKNTNATPGQVILNLSEEQRDALKELKSDDLKAELIYGLFGTKVVVRKRSKTLIEKMIEHFGPFKRH